MPDITALTCYFITQLMSNLFLGKDRESCKKTPLNPPLIQNTSVIYGSAIGKKSLGPIRRADPRITKKILLSTLRSLYLFRSSKGNFRIAFRLLLDPPFTTFSLHHSAHLQ